LPHYVTVETVGRSGLLNNTALQTLLQGTVSVSCTKQRHVSRSIVSVGNRHVSKSIFRVGNRHVSRSIVRVWNIGVHRYCFKSDTDKRNKSLTSVVFWDLMQRRLVES
jgi:hypothetical protein